MDKKIVRVSPHFFNTESQILDVIDASKETIAFLVLQLPSLLV